MNPWLRLRKRVWELRWILLAEFLGAIALGYVLAEVTKR